MEYFENIPNKLADTNSFAGGLNTFYDRAFIEDDQLSYAVNVNMYRYPRVVTRASRNTLATLLDKGLVANGMTVGEKVIDMWAWNEDRIFIITSTFEDGEYTYYLECLYRYESNFYHAMLDNSVGTFISGTKWYMTYARKENAEYLYITTERGKYKITLTSEAITELVDTYTITYTTENIEDEYYGPSAFRKGRMWFLNTTNNIITCSKINEFDNFEFEHVIDPISGEELEVYTADGPCDFGLQERIGNVIALVPFDNKMIVFCENSMHAIYGNSNYDGSNGSSSDIFAIVDFNNGIGAISRKSIDVGNGILYWLSNDLKIYAYNGASLSTISRPYQRSSYDILRGGIENLIDIDLFDARDYLQNIQIVATNRKVYVNYSIDPFKSTHNDMMLVYDLGSATWWNEDGYFTYIAKYQEVLGTILCASDKYCSDILIEGSKQKGDTDLILKRPRPDADVEMERVPIKYRFETKVYGPQYVSNRGSLSDIWLQAKANADIYLGDYWTTVNQWKGYSTFGYKLIEHLNYEEQARDVKQYDSEHYEQIHIPVPKLYGERLNSFSILVEGEGKSEWYLMQRKWRVN